ncbi:MAG: hypothetical protein E7216_00650 [Clostridium thermopalmarium]|uniref:hypothetical protein n=1 Tax=Clostridium thermopalmarium TaxID=29373 RepID=UPI0023557872|nr:hypothetical protein [Clostridium thermopalmarium]MBE6042765.1 hypothetical protein [Clostridium thermopalmarium]
MTKGGGYIFSGEGSDKITLFKFDSNYNIDNYTDMDRKTIKYVETKTSTGDEYIGETVDDLRDGRGNYVFSNGDIYSEFWGNDKFDGYGIFQSKDGAVKRGIWKNGDFYEEGRFENKVSEMCIGDINGDNELELVEFVEKYDIDDYTFPQDADIVIKNTLTGLTLNPIDLS